MTPVHFASDERKNGINQKKHRVSFAEARTVFYDENARLILDPGHSNGTKTIRGEIAMRKQYDFSKSKKNPYAKLLKRQVTIRLEAEIIDYFKKLASETGIPYQNLINLYLKDCASSRRKLALRWAS